MEPPPRRHTDEPCSAGPALRTLRCAQGRLCGSSHVLLAPVGFVCDHVEILYDIDIFFREYGKARGVTVHRSESLNNSPLFIQALAAIVTARAGEQ